MNLFPWPPPPPRNIQPRPRLIFPLIPLRLLSPLALLLLLLRLLVPIGRHDRVRALHLMLHLIIPPRHVVRQRLRPPNLARLIRRLAPLHLRALGDVPRKWIDRRHPHLTYRFGAARNPNYRRAR